LLYERIGDVLKKYKYRCLATESEESN